MRPLLAGLTAIVVLFPIASSAQMYKCVDERGVTTYSDKPRPGCKGKEVDIRASPPISGKLQERKGDAARDEADFKRRQIARERTEATEKAERERLEQHCARVRQDIGVLTGARRIYSVNDKGERVYMEDEARDQRLAQLRAELQGCP